MPLPPSHKLPDHKLVNSLSKQHCSGCMISPATAFICPNSLPTEGRFQARREMISTSFRTSRAALTRCLSGEIRKNKLVEKGGRVWTKHTSLLDVAAGGREETVTMKRMTRVKQTTRRRIPETETHRFLLLIGPTRRRTQIKISVVCGKLCKIKQSEFLGVFFYQM